MRTMIDYSSQNNKISEDIDQLYVTAAVLTIQNVVKSGWRTRVLISADVLDGTISKGFVQPDYKDRPRPVLRPNQLGRVNHIEVARALFRRGLFFSQLFVPVHGVYYIIELHETYEFEG